jgi:hypothetical protein
MLVIAILRIISIWPVWIWIKSHRDRTLFTSTKDLFNLIRVSNADTATIYVPINTPDPDESRFAESLKVFHNYQGEQLDKQEQNCHQSIMASGLECLD